MFNLSLGLKDSRRGLLRHGRDRLHRPLPDRAAAGARGRHPRARAQGLARQAREARRELGRSRSASSRSEATCRSPRSASPRAGSRPTRAQIDHFFHLAAIYDMTADEERNRDRQRRGHAPRGRGRQRARARAASTTSRRSPPRGSTRAPSPRTCSTRASRSTTPTTARSSSPRGSRARRPTVPWRVYRPAIVVGHSQTGEMDKIDGPYYFFKALKMGARLPEIVPLFGPRMGETNIVPGRLRRRRAGPHRPRARPRRQGVPPRQPRAAGLGRPHQHLRPGRRRAAHHGRAARRGAAAGAQVPGVRGHLLPGLGIPGEASTTSAFTARFDAAQTHARRSPAPGSRCRRSRTTRRRCGTTGSGSYRRRADRRRRARAGRLDGRGRARDRRAGVGGRRGARRRELARAGDAVPASGCPDDVLDRALAWVAEHGVRTVGCWAAREDDAGLGRRSRRAASRKAGSRTGWRSRRARRIGRRARGGGRERAGVGPLRPAAAGAGRRADRPFVARVEGELAGFAWLHAPAGETVAGLFDVVVFPEHRRRGLGRALTAAACAAPPSSAART